MRRKWGRREGKKERERGRKDRRWQWEKKTGEKGGREEERRGIWKVEGG